MTLALINTDEFIRNRIHAKNTRDRKRLHLSQSVKKIEILMYEKYRLKHHDMIPEDSVVNILVSLSKQPSTLHGKSLSSHSFDKISHTFSDDVIVSDETTARNEKSEITGNEKKMALLSKEVEFALRQEASRATIRTVESIKSSVASIMNSIKGDLPDMELDEKFIVASKKIKDIGSEELNSLRKERNRIHAKKTRYRKKLMLTKIHGITKILEAEGKFQT